MQAPGQSLAEDYAVPSGNALVAQGINPLGGAPRPAPAASVVDRYLDKKLQELSSKPSKNAYKHTLVSPAMHGAIGRLRRCAGMTCFRC